MDEFDPNLLVAPIFGLIGLGLGFALNQWAEKGRRKADRDAEQLRRDADRADETARWFRDNRLSMYVDFLRATSMFQHLASELDSISYTAEQADAARRQLHSAIGAMTSASSTLSIVAPRPVVFMAGEIELMSIECIEWVVDGVPLQGNLDRQRHWHTLGQWYGALAAAAAVDLSGHPIEQTPRDLPSTPRWTKGKGWLDDRLN